MLDSNVQLWSVCVRRTTWRDIYHFEIKRFRTKRRSDAQPKYETCKTTRTIQQLEHHWQFLCLLYRKIPIEYLLRFKAIKNNKKTSWNLLTDESSWCCCLVVIIKSCVCIYYIASCMCLSIFCCTVFLLYYIAFVPLFLQIIY